MITYEEKRKFILEFANFAHVTLRDEDIDEAIEQVDKLKPDIWDDQYKMLQVAKQIGEQIVEKYNGSL